MPSHAACNSEIKQLYINGHFCYIYKFGMITNGLGIVRDISFYNKGFLESHPEIIIDKKSDSPDKDKSLHDATNIYRDLLTDLKFDKAYIPLNRRSSLKHPDYTLNGFGIPCCPNDPTLPMKPEGNISHLRCGIKTFKFYALK